jgi:hypothetical protein
MCVDANVVVVVNVVNVGKVGPSLVHSHTPDGRSGIVHGCSATQLAFLFCLVLHDCPVIERWAVRICCMPCNVQVERSTGMLLCMANLYVYPGS